MTKASEKYFAKLDAKFEQAEQEQAKANNVNRVQEQKKTFANKGKGTETKAKGTGKYNVSLAKEQAKAKAEKENERLQNVLENRDLYSVQTVKGNGNIFADYSECVKRGDMSERVLIQTAKVISYSIAKNRANVGGNGKKSGKGNASQISAGEKALFSIWNSTDVNRMLTLNDNSVLITNADGEKESIIFDKELEKDVLKTFADRSTDSTGADMVQECCLYLWEMFTEYTGKDLNEIPFTIEFTRHYKANGDGVRTETKETSFVGYLFWKMYKYYKTFTARRDTSLDAFVEIYGENGMRYIEHNLYMFACSLCDTGNVTTADVENVERLCERLKLSNVEKEIVLVAVRMSANGEKVNRETDIVNGTIEKIGYKALARETGKPSDYVKVVLKRVKAKIFKYYESNEIEHIFANVKAEKQAKAEQEQARADREQEQKTRADVRKYAVKLEQAKAEREQEQARADREKEMFTARAKEQARAKAEREQARARAEREQSERTHKMQVYFAD